MRGPLLFAALFALVRAEGSSNIDPSHALVDADLLGVLNWRPSPEAGAVVSQYYCSGYIYSSTVGWISLGSGVPANGAAYSNGSATDYGVNVSPSGELSGFAYGANIGWINFAAAGHASVDFATGQLSGNVWAANLGWISLTSAQQFVRLQSLPALPDTDGDGLPDAWEIAAAGKLNLLSSNSDTDQDGQSDYAEFLSGTNPLDPSDYLGPIHLALISGGRQIEFPTKPDHVYRIEATESLSGPWSPVSLPTVLGTGETAKVPLPVTTADLSFYRVAGYPPLSQP